MQHIDKIDFEAPIKEDNDTTESVEVFSVEDVEENKHGDWNYNIKVLLKNLGEKSMGYRWMHEQEANYYDDLDEKYGKIAVVLGAILGALTGSDLITTQSGTIGTVLKVSEFILALSVTIVMGIKENGDYKFKYYNHKQVASDFTQLYHGIQEQFALNLSERDKDSLFLRSKIREYDGLMEKPLNIRKETLDGYMKATDNNDIYKPVITGQIEQIEIVEDRVEAKVSGKMKIDGKTKYEIERWMKNF